jgi:hypothetical protein
MESKYDERQAAQFYNAGLDEFQLRIERNLPDDYQSRGRAKQEVMG